MSNKFNPYSKLPTQKSSVVRHREMVSKVEIALAASNLLIAERGARQLQTQFPEDSTANFFLAQVLVAKNEIKQAMPFAEIAVKHAPFHPGTNYFLGRIYLSLELYEKAAPLFQESIRLAPNSSLLYWALADMYQAMNQGETAAKNYKIALSLPLDSDRKSEIKMLYAICLASIDRHNESAQLLRELQHLPTVRGFYFLEETNRKRDDTSELEKELRLELANSSPQDSNTPLLYHALGNILDKQKSPDEAWENWEISRSLDKKRDFQIDAYVGTADNLISFYSRDRLISIQDHGNKSELPIFVFGMARSGTTLTEQIIAAHKDGSGVGELARFASLEHHFFDRYVDSNNDALMVRNVKNGELERSANEILNLLNKLVAGHPKRIVDKAVNQYQAAGFIHACFPQARFIHCNRHPADTFVSAFQNRLDHAYVSNQIHYAKFFLAKEKLMQHWRTCFPEQIFDLHYEKLVQDPEAIVRQMIEFLGLEWDSNCMKFFEQKSTVKTLSLTQVRQPIYTSSVYKWKKYEKHLSPLLSTLKEANFEYPKF